MSSISNKATLSRRRHRQRRQCGIVLLEAMISIALFGFGILALIAFQVRYVGMVADVGARAEVARLTNAYIGQMWTAGSDLNNIEKNYTEGSSAYEIFVNDLHNAIGIGNPSIKVNVAVNTDNAAARHAWATVSVSWQDRENGTTHKFQQSAGIGS